MPGSCPVTSGNPDEEAVGVLSLLVIQARKVAAETGNCPESSKPFHSLESTNSRVGIRGLQMPLGLDTQPRLGVIRHTLLCLAHSPPQPQGPGGFVGSHPLFTHLQLAKLLSGPPTMTPVLPPISLSTLQEVCL